MAEDNKYAAYQNKYLDGAGVGYLWEKIKSQSAKIARVSGWASNKIILVSTDEQDKPLIDMLLTASLNQDVMIEDTNDSYRRYYFVKKDSSNFIWENHSDTDTIYRITVSGTASSLTLEKSINYYKDRYGYEIADYVAQTYLDGTTIKFTDGHTTPSSNNLEIWFNNNNIYVTDKIANKNLTFDTISNAISATKADEATNATYATYIGTEGANYSYTTLKNKFNAIPTFTTTNWPTSTTDGSERLLLAYVDSSNQKSIKASSLTIDSSTLSSNSLKIPTSKVVKDYVDTEVAKIDQFRYVVSTDAATTPKDVEWQQANGQSYTTIKGTLAASKNTEFIIYLVPGTVGDAPAISGTYVEYLTVNKGTSSSPIYAWEKIGTTKADLTGYQKEDADLTAIANLTGTSGLLRKTQANTWSLDTTSYLTSHAYRPVAITPANSTKTTILTATENNELVLKAGDNINLSESAKGEIVINGVGDEKVAQDKTTDSQYDYPLLLGATSSASMDATQTTTGKTKWSTKITANAGSGQISASKVYLTDSIKINKSGITYPQVEIGTELDSYDEEPTIVLRAENNDKLVITSGYLYNTKSGSTFNIKLPAKAGTLALTNDIKSYSAGAGLTLSTTTFSVNTLTTTDINAIIGLAEQD